MKNEAYEECKDYVGNWVRQASDTSLIARILLQEIAKAAEEKGVKVNYDVRD